MKSMYHIVCSYLKFGCYKFQLFLIIDMKQHLSYIVIHYNFVVSFHQAPISCFLFEPLKDQHIAEHVKSMVVVYIHQLLEESTLSTY